MQTGCCWERRIQTEEQVDKSRLGLRVRKRETLDLRWREQGARKGDKGRLWLRVQVWVTRLLVSMSRILPANCAHEAADVKGQLLPCNAVPFQACFTIRIHECTGRLCQLLQSWETGWCYDGIPVRTEDFDLWFGFIAMIFLSPHSIPPTTHPPLCAPCRN